MACVAAITGRRMRKPKESPFCILNSKLKTQTSPPGAIETASCGPTHAGRGRVFVGCRACRGGASTLLGLGCGPDGSGRIGSQPVLESGHPACRGRLSCLIPGWKPGFRNSQDGCSPPAISPLQSQMHYRILEKAAKSSLRPGTHSCQFMQFVVQRISAKNFNHE